MARRLLYLASSALILTACAGHQAAQTQADAQASADLQVAYMCITDVMKSAGYPVVKDDRQLRVSGLIREELPTGELQARGGSVGGANSTDVGNPPAPYEIDGVIATVSADRKNGGVHVDAKAYTGVGATAKSGYSERSASVRGAAVVKRMQACTEPPPS